MKTFAGMIKSILITSFSSMLLIFTACGGEGGSILDNFIPNDMNLKSMQVSNGNLCPAFDPDIFAYNLEVDSDCTSINLTALKNNPSDIVIINLPKSSVKANDQPVTIDLKNISTKVSIKVSSANNNKNIKNYVLIVKKIVQGIQSGNANLSNLVLSNGTLSPYFSPDITAYNVEVPASLENIKIAAVPAGIKATVAINGNPLETGKDVVIEKASWNIPAKIEVTAENGNKKTYNLMVRALAPDTTSNNADLARLIVSTGNLCPIFDANVLTYSLEVPAGTNFVTVNATAAGVDASIRVNEMAVDSGEKSDSIKLIPGNNRISIKITADNGVEKTYIINVTVLDKKVSSNCSLAGLNLSTGSLNPAFLSEDTSYTAVVSNDIETIQVTPFTASDKALVKVNGIQVYSGMPSEPVELESDSTEIRINVTAEDFSSKIYTLTISKSMTASSNADLQSLTLSHGVLVPGFTSHNTHYSAEVNSNISSITVTPVTCVSGSTITVNDFPVLSQSSSQDIPLATGVNTITVVVTAQNQTSTNTYVITVTRPAEGESTNASLQGISLSKGTLSPQFSFNTLNYSAEVGNVDSSITVIATTYNPNAVIKINNTDAVSGIESSPVNLEVGSNRIEIIVTAEDGITQKVYIIDISRRSASLSNNAYLADLLISKGTLQPVFTPENGEYSVPVLYVDDTINVTPTVQDSKATVKVMGKTVASGTKSDEITIVEGVNTISIVVTAEDGNTNMGYTIEVTGQANVLSNNADLRSLVLSDVTLTPSFSSGQITYTGSVAYEVTTTNVTAVTDETHAALTVNNNPVGSGAECQVPLKVGSNTIVIVVTAQDATQKTYTVTVNRTGNNNADIASIILTKNYTVGLSTNSYNLTVDNFEPDTLTYTVECPYHSGELAPKIHTTATLSDPNATVEISNQDQSVILLPKTITIVVTAEDGITTKTYTFNIVRP